MRKLNVFYEMNIGPTPIDLDIGSVAQSDIELGDIRCSVLYKITKKVAGRQYNAEVVAFAFSTHEDYHKFLSAGAEEGNNGTDIYVAENEELSFLHEKKLQGGTIIAGYLPYNMTDGAVEGTTDELIVINSKLQPDGSYRISMEPFNLAAKRRFLLAARNEPWLVLDR